jgi:general secretion pathway protein G
VKEQIMKTRQEGFTLIEIMLVVVIIGILMTIVVVKLGGRQEQARVTAAQADIRAYSMALNLFELDTGSYPTTEQGLQALITQPTTPPTVNNWKGPYIESGQLHKDPWGNDYLYKYPGEKKPHGFDLYSFGPNRVEGGDDDITNWQ